MLKTNSISEEETINTQDTTKRPGINHGCVGSSLYLLQAAQIIEPHGKQVASGSGASRLDVRFVPCEDEGDLQPTAECLVEQKAGLEGGHEREPREHRHWDEDKYAHSRVIQTSNLA